MGGRTKGTTPEGRSHARKTGLSEAADGPLEKPPKGPSQRKEKKTFLRNHMKESEKDGGAGKERRGQRVLFRVRTTVKKVGARGNNCRDATRRHRGKGGGLDKGHWGGAEEKSGLRGRGGKPRAGRKEGILRSFELKKKRPHQKGKSDTLEESTCR